MYCLFYKETITIMNCIEIATPNFYSQYSVNSQHAVNFSVEKY